VTMNLFADCPVCHASLRWTYVMRPIWSRWRCEGCGSLLGVDGKRRMLSVLVMLVVLLGGVLLAPAGMDVAMPLLALAVWAPVFLVLERARVLERCGLRCKTCGYDLRGQVTPRCPECGRDLEESERAMLATGALPATSARPRRPAWIMVALLIVCFVATGVAVGLTRYWGSRARMVRPAAVTSQPTLKQAAPGEG
jgi:hypothetical protein